jgi:hypothetical protein
MQLPALKNTVPASLDGMSIEDFIRNSTRNLATIPTGANGSGVDGAQYLKFDGNSGIWKFNREPINPESFGHIVVPIHGIYETIIEWANGAVLQRATPRQLLGVKYDEPMTERMLSEPLSPKAYKKDNDGPSYTLGFVGFLIDDGVNVIFEHSSGGAKKAFKLLATNITQALAAFKEIVHPVFELGVSSYENRHRTIFEPLFNISGYVTDRRVSEASAIEEDDIMPKPPAPGQASAKVKPAPSKAQAPPPPAAAKPRRWSREAPAV